MTHMEWGGGEYGNKHRGNSTLNKIDIISCITDLVLCMAHVL